MSPRRVAPGLCRAEGMIKNVNTIEDYRNLDKSAILTQAGRTVSNINTSMGFGCCDRLQQARFGMLSMIARSILVRRYWRRSS